MTSTNDTPAGSYGTGSPSMTRRVKRHHANLRAMLRRQATGELTGRNAAATRAGMEYHARELRAGIHYLTARQQDTARQLIAQVFPDA